METNNTQHTRTMQREAIKTIVDNATESNYIKHAKYEMELAYGKFEDMDDMQRLVCNQVIELLAVLSTQGDSGSSIGYKTALLNKLIKFETIKPLTFEDDEFDAPYNNAGCRQNKRLSSVFKYPDGTFKYIDGVVTDRTKVCRYIDGNNYEFEENTGHCVYNCTSVLILKEDGTLTKLRHINIIPSVFKSSTITLDACEIEYTKDWWTTVVKEKELSKLKGKYELVFEELKEDEFVSRNGVDHTEEIMKRIKNIK